MANKTPVTIELTPQQVQWLESKTADHGLPNIGKAVRCLINHARDEASADEAIFGTIRCPDC